MSIFENGGGTLASTTIPQASLDLISLFTEAEKTLLATVGVPLKATWSTDMIGQITNFAVTLPNIEAINAVGRAEMVPQNFLGETLGAFDPGAGGDLISDTLVGALVEHATKVNRLEKLIPTTVATITPNTHNVSYDTEAQTVTIAINLPVATVIDPAGGLKMTAIDFLA